MARVKFERTPDGLDVQPVIERDEAEALEFRVVQQAQWELADEVRQGRLPRVDPDSLTLEEIDEGVRIYRSREVSGTIDGRPAMLSQRLVKRLVNGCWENDLEVEYYRYADEPHHLAHLEH